jgi:parallel beta-helix repeat protein
MKNRYLVCVILFFLLLTPVSLANNTIQKPADLTLPFTDKATIYVDDSNTEGPWNGSAEYPYRHINDGVFHALEGDIVYVFSGLYNETVCLNKSIVLRGQDPVNTIIDGHNNASVITIYAPDVFLGRFTIRNSGGYDRDAGIAVAANFTTISDCVIYRARAGIALYSTSEQRISSCRFHTNGYGIHCSTSAFITVDSCTFYHNGVGIYLFETNCITIGNSYADTNGIGFLFERSSNIEITKSAARDNDDNEGGMFFDSCSFVNILNCYSVHNGVGVFLSNSTACYLDRCNFSLNTHFSCKFDQAVSGIILTRCICTQNLRYGLYAENSAFSISWSNLNKNKNYGLYAKTSVIDARYNWWGCPRGPAHNGLTKADRGTWNPRDIAYAPWLTFSMPDIGPDWVLDNTFEKPTYVDPWPEQIVFDDPDTDGDGTPDWWEIKWGYDPTIPDDHQHLDPDNDSLNNVEECYMDEYGSSPFHQDVFLEFDWTTSINPDATNKPPEQEVTQMIDAFAKHNITLHVDTGELGGGEELSALSFVSYAEIISLYWDYFLHSDLNNPRQRIFHYGIICDYSEGPGFAVIGWSHLNAFIIAAQSLTESFPRDTRGWLAVGASMHEVGHTFGLIVTKYNGIDNHNTVKPYYKEFWLYLPYRSILNYLYTYQFMDFSDGSHGPRDYDDWGNLDFSFFKNTTFCYPI